MKNLILSITLLFLCVNVVAQRSKKPWDNGLYYKNRHFHEATTPLDTKGIYKHYAPLNQNLIKNNTNSQIKPNISSSIEKMVNGINVAWINFGRDTGVDPNGGDNYHPDMTEFEKVMDFVVEHGGNTLRWWYHTNGSTNPIYDDNQMVAPNPDFFHQDVKALLDLAHSKGLKIQICLWSFDMLKDQWAVDATANKKLLTEDEYMEAYINNALIPLVNAIGEHPGLFAIEIFNEPEGMTNRYASHWPGFKEKVEMHDIQKFINKTSGAIRREQPNVKITNGALGLLTNSEDPDNSFWNAYSDINLINAGGDQDGYLDFYNAHYYSWQGENGSPFHNTYDPQKVDRELVVAEYYPDNLNVATPTIPATDLGNKIIDNNWAGSLVWSWTDRTGTQERNNMAAIIKSISDWINNDNENTPPVANAGNDQVVTDLDRNGSEIITLNGSGSFDSDGSIMLYTWSKEGVDLAEGAQVDIELSTGKHTISLTVEDNKGAKSVDDVLIEIKENNDSEPSKVIYEAEEAILSRVKIKLDPEASKQEYVYMEGNNGKITWEIEAPLEGTYDLDIGYRLPYGSKQQFLNVNASYIGSFLFEGSTNKWLIKTIPLDLNQGSNTVTLTANWGYMDFDFISLNNNNTSQIRISEVNNISVYPVPAKNQLTVSGLETGDYIAIYNIMGEKLITSKASNRKALLDISKLSPGYYTVSVFGKETKRFIKNN